MSGAVGEMETKMPRRGRGLGQAVCVGEQTSCTISVGSTRVRGAAGPAASTANWPCSSVYALPFPGQSPALFHSPGPAFDLPFFFNFLFWNNFRFRDKLQRQYREFPYTHHPASSNVHILHNCGTFLRTKKLTLGQHY